MSESTLAAQWTDLKATLRSRLAEVYAQLDTVSANAVQTLDDRIKKVQGPLAAILKRCRDSVEHNVRSATLQKQFILAQLEAVDQVMSETSQKLSAAATSPALEAFARDAEVALVGPLIASTTKMAFEALCLCALLSAVLGHKEANAFVEGAKQELIGAIGDPGAGVFTLLKRAYAVGTRMLRKDQDAAELLSSLADFEDFLQKWREIAGEMARDTPFPEALETVFLKDAKG